MWSRRLSIARKCWGSRSAELSLKAEETLRSLGTTHSLRPADIRGACAEKTMVSYDNGDCWALEACKANVH